MLAIDRMTLEYYLLVTYEIRIVRICKCTCTHEYPLYVISHDARLSSRYVNTTSSTEH